MREGEDGRVWRESIFRRIPVPRVVKKVCVVRQTRNFVRMGPSGSVRGLSWGLSCTVTWKPGIVPGYWDATNLTSTIVRQGVACSSASFALVTTR